jgi:hypothetical protein
MRGLLQRKPELLAIPFYVFWGIINVFPWPWLNGRSVISIASGWTTDFLTGHSTPIYPLTFILAWVSFGFATLALHRSVGLSLGKSFLLGSTFPFCFVSVFEIVWQNVGIVMRPTLFHTDVFGELLLLSWALVGLSSIQFWKMTRKGALVVASILITLTLWIGFGYPQWFEGGGIALALNLLLKFQFFILFMILLSGK